MQMRESCDIKGMLAEEGQLMELSRRTLQYISRTTTSVSSQWQTISALSHYKDLAYAIATDEKIECPPATLSPALVNLG
jgi:hypothetical protein